MAGIFLLCCLGSFVLAHGNFASQKNNFDASNYGTSTNFARYNSPSNYHRSLDQDSAAETIDLSDSDSFEAEPAVTLRLYGNTMMGYYYVTMFFGSPLQRQNLIVDTGSTITTIPCTECGSECGTKHFNKPFETNRSISHENFKCNERFNNYMCNDCENKCPFQIGYTEGSSYQGHFTKDYVVFGNDIEDHYFKKGYMNIEEVNSTDSLTHLRPSSSVNEPIPEKKTQLLPTPEVDSRDREIDKIIENRRVFMPFGCTVKETKLFYYQEADGILGLGVYTNSLKLPPNVVDVYGNTKIGAFNAFSICFADEGGLFTIGGYNTSHHDPTDTVQYVPFYADSGQYRVHMHRIEFEGGDLGISEDSLNNGQGAFFDSGTTLAYAPSYTVKAIKDALNQYCSQKGGNCGGNRRRGTCWLYNPETNPTVEDFYASFGTFNFYFGEEGEKKYEWRAEDFLYQETAGSRWFCLGLEVFEDRTILGGTFMKNHDIMFDKRQKRIGFVRANCSTHIPEYISRMTIDKSSESLDNLIALVIIISIALTIYGLIRVNRLWHNKNKYFSPLKWVENTKNFSFKFMRLPSSKTNNKVTCF